MPSKRQWHMAVLGASFIAIAMTAGSQPPNGDRPEYENGTELKLPADYRSWPFIGAGLGMTYDGERGTQEGSINRAGRFATRLTFLEAEVKDARFPDGWAFYAFGPGDNWRAPPSRSQETRSQRASNVIRSTRPSSALSCSSIRICSRSRAPKAR